MPRQPRLDLPGVPQHVIQRGNDRQPCFLREQDYRCYLSQLNDAARSHGCRIHAYVLMTNHVHLLMTPDTAGAVARTMQSQDLRGRRFKGTEVIKCRPLLLLAGLVVDRLQAFPAFSRPCAGNVRLR
jgi:REP element-mobilizing transposase RayT